MKDGSSPSREREISTISQHVEISLNELIHRQNLKLAELLEQKERGDESPLLAANLKQAEVFKRPPSSRQVQEFLERAFDVVGVKPKYLVTDRGKQFGCPDFAEAWCERRGIKPRFGAVGKYGSIAVVERFNRTLKYEGLFLIAAPFSLDRMREETALYVRWFNECRPHQSLNGRTPDEVYQDRPPANEKRRWEPRRNWPRESLCASPQAPVLGRRGVRLGLKVAFLEGRRHLPVVRLRPAA